MRVLWFVNSAPNEISNFCLGTKSNSAGWIDSLYRELKSELEIGIVFHANVKEFKFGIFENVEYFILPQNSNVIMQVFEYQFGIYNPLKYLHNYYSIINQFKPDVIHIFGTESSFGLIQENINIPCVVHIQGLLSNVQLYFRGSFTNYELILNSGFKKFLAGTTWLKLFRMIKNRAVTEKKILGITSVICGRTILDRRYSKFFNPSVKYYHINEILRDEFYNQKQHNYNSKVKFIIFSTMNPNLYKGLELVIQISRILRSNELGSFEFRIAGIDMLNPLFKLVQYRFGKGIFTDNIKFLGGIDSLQLRNEMVNADVFLHPTYCDNSPNSVCEAMILGLPVISTNSGGIPSLIQNGVDGFLVQAGDYISMASLILELFYDKEKREEIGINAKKAAIVRHDKKIIIEKTMNLYKELFETRNINGNE